MKGRIAAVIVNYNTRDDLFRCLQSISSNSDCSVMVVDNASTDGSAEMVRTQFPRHKLIARERNAGFGAGANLGIHACDEPCVLLLNSDTIIESSLTPLVQYLDNNPQAGIAGPRLLNSDGTLQPSCYPFPGTIRWLIDNDAGAKILAVSDKLRSWGLRSWAHDHARDVPWVKGAALAIRRSAFEAVHGFDESIFLYHEETDLCYRLRAAGWRIHFAPVVEIVHTGGQSTSQNAARMLVQLYDGTVGFYQRHYSPVRTFFLVALWKVIALLRWGRSWYQLRFSSHSGSANPESMLYASKAILTGQRD